MRLDRGMLEAILENLTGSNDGVARSTLENAINEDRPIVAILGQLAGIRSPAEDSVIVAALSRLGVEGESWNDIFATGALNSEFYSWLNERFERRSPTNQLVSISNAHFSSVFTSSFDPVLRTLFESDGRQPEAALVGDSPRPVSRSKLRPRIHYLFGMTGAGAFEPPRSKLELNRRRTKHAIPMLNTTLEIATPLGLIVVDGFCPKNDWLKASDVLSELSLAPTNSVLWFGGDPEFNDEDAEVFLELIESKIVLRDARPLGIAIAEAQATGSISALHHWNEPGVITFSNRARLVTNPSMRLSTEASASILDDAWLDPLPDLDEVSVEESFSVFHSIPANNRAIFDGVRRGFAINRDFEKDLFRIVERAIQNHANEKGAIVVSGQSGIGKSIALYRLALLIREKKQAAVLFARDRIPSAVALGAFLSEVDKLGQVTLLIVDALAPPARYDALLESFRSRGHRIVVLGSSYYYADMGARHDGKLITANAILSKEERLALLALASRFSVDGSVASEAVKLDHALAQFFWNLPYSRNRLAAGLGREARTTERSLRERGQTRKRVTQIGTMGLALIEAGYKAEAPILAEMPDTDEEDQAAGRIIDYVMACARVNRWVPINLILRALLSKQLASDIGVSVELVRDLFDGHDLFRWRYDDNSGDQLLVGARLQIEAQLICDQRLGGPRFEAAQVIELVSNATRAGPEGAEETRFVAEIVYALGPDGPLGDRYRESYREIASALTKLRKANGIRNARLMLQEATLRRHYIRRNESTISEEDRIRILDEAREAVDEALSNLTGPSTGLRAARRTTDNLWVERAATYGFLATTAAKRGDASEIVWTNYLAAREAVRNATGKVDSYYPLDISLWLPLEIIEHREDLGLERSTELRADVLSSLDMVNPDELDTTQAEIYQRQRLRAGGVLQDEDLSDDAFKALEEVGSTVGYYFRARSYAPRRSYVGEPPTEAEITKANRTAAYLLRHREKVSEDPRCMRLLLDSFWLWKAGSWLFSDLRQAIPAAEADRTSIFEILSDLSYASGDDFQPRFRYLIATLTWLLGDERSALQEFRQLARDTEYVEGKRVLPRHIITDEAGKPVAFSGVIERRIGDQRWSLRVRQLNRLVDFVPGRTQQDIAVGTELRNFNVCFNYIGPIAQMVR